MAWGDKGNDGNDNFGPWGRPPSPSGGGKKPTPPSGNPGPDLEEALRKAQEKLRERFGGDGDDGAKGMSLLAAVAIVLWMASGVYFVKADEQGVVLRFGQYHRTTGAGLNYHIPFPIEKALTPRVTAINHVEVGLRSGGNYRRGRGNDNSLPEESLMLTGDENIVDINFEVQWKINDAPDYLFNVRDPEYTVKSVAESAMREVIGKSKIATVLAEGKLIVEQDTKKLIQETLNHYSAGIEVVSVNLLKADPPAQVIDAFRDVQTARADMETARNQAEAYSNDILPKARGEAQKLVLDAEAYKQEVIARAQGEASRFAAIYDEYKQARNVTRKRMYLETMESILPGLNKMIIEGKSGSGVVPYLPLDELKNKKSGEAQP